MCLKLGGALTTEQREKEASPRGHEEGRQWQPTTFVVGVAA
jgi:hypothetical protein